jgi:hypothetical protein
MNFLSFFFFDNVWFKESKRRQNFENLHLSFVCPINEKGRETKERGKQLKKIP